MTPDRISGGLMRAVLAASATLSTQAPAPAASRMILPADDSSPIPDRHTAERTLSYREAQQNENFDLGATDRQMIWGGGAQDPTRYFAEFLPVYFERQLSLKEQLPSGSSLDWIFTGTRGGVTVRINAKTITLEQRYYDSFGLNNANSTPDRYPEKIWEKQSVSLQQAPRTVTVTSKGMSVSVDVDGVEVLTQRTLLDLSRHQIKLSRFDPAKRDAPAGSDPADRQVFRIPLSMSQPAPEPVSLTVDRSERHQTILGFGGIVSFPAYAMLDPEQKDAWIKKLQEDNLLVQREYPVGTKLNRSTDNFADPKVAVPHYYGQNFPNGEVTDFEFSRKLRSIGGKVVFEFWQLPEWIQDPKIKKIDVSKYAAAIVSYCRQAKAATGKPPEIVGIQNEVIQTPETWARMVTILRRALDQAGFAHVKIHMPDASYLHEGITSAEKLRSNAVSWRQIDFSATHLYDYQDFFGEPEKMGALFARWKELVQGKPFLATELAVNRGALQGMASYRSAFSQALLYHYLLSDLDATLLAYCWLLLDAEQPTFLDTRSLFRIDREHSFAATDGIQRRTFAAFSRRLPEGMRRIGATTDDKDVLVTAYSAPEFGDTLILLNKSDRPKRINVASSRMQFQTMERSSAYDDVKLATPPNDEHVLIMPGEIVTLSNVPLRGR